MDRPCLRSLRKSYAAVSMGVSSQRHSSRELARFLRSNGRRTFAPSQTVIESTPDYSAVQAHSKIRVLNKEQK
jgi:hypothetical protein